MFSRNKDTDQHFYDIYRKKTIKYQVISIWSIMSKNKYFSEEKQ